MENEPPRPAVPPRINRGPLSRSQPNLGGVRSTADPHHPPLPTFHKKISQLRMDEENTSAFRTYKRLFQLVVEVIGPDPVTKAKAEDIFNNSQAVKDLRKVDTITLKQERDLLLFIQKVEEILSSN